MRAANLLCLLAAPAVCVALFLIGSPPAQAAVPGDEHWDSQFGPVGVNESAWSVASWRGRVYTGGIHTAAGNTMASAIAAFDGTNWAGLDNGILGGQNLTYVYAMQQDSSYLYVGGWFTNADNSGARYVARWDGASWSRMGSDLTGMGSDLTGPVFTLRLLGTNLYAGGIFPTDEAGSSYNCVARWAGDRWEMIGGEFAGGFPTVNAIETDGTNLVVGGRFSSAGGVPASNVAQWNGSAWSALGSGISGNVFTLLYQNGRLHAGGSFTNTAAGYTNLVDWSGGVWVPWSNPNRSVRDLITDGTNIYAGGDFTGISGQAFNRIARWDGTNWSPLGTGVQGFGVAAIPGVYKMALGPDGRLFAAGNFNIMGGKGASHVAAWNGSAWSGLGGTTSKGLTHFIGFVSSFLPHGNDLYVGGLFTEAGDQVVNSIARWNGTNWFALGSGLVGTFVSGVAPTARGLTFVGPDLYVGGNFTNAGGVSARGFARWDGANWFNVGDSDALVRALVYDGSLVFVGGNFTNIGGINSPGLALHVPGGGWLSLGTLAGGSRSVATLARDGTDIYIGGNFTSINGQPLTNIAHWNGSGWMPLGNGVNNTVNAIAASNGIVYAGGTFTVASGVGVNRIAQWDGVAWSPLGAGVAGTTASTTINNLLLRGGDLYAAGTFTTAGDVPALGLAKWDGTSWSAPFGSGLVHSPGTATATGLAWIGDDFYVGGQFAFAGDKPSMFFARWNDRRNFYRAANPRLIHPEWLTNGQFRVRLTGTSGERYMIESADALTNWTPRLTNSVPLFDYIDPAASTTPDRLYRAVLR